mgnify:CR=1 FL=1
MNKEIVIWKSYDGKSAENVDEKAGPFVSKSREATQDTDLEQNGASLNIHLETSTTKHSSSYRESPKSLANQNHDVTLIDIKSEEEFDEDFRKLILKDKMIDIRNKLEPDIIA